MNSRDYREVSNSDDLIDSRDVIAMVADLESQIEDLEDQVKDLDSEEDQDQIDQLQDEIQDLQNKLEPIQKFASEAENCSSDWQYGSTIIRDSYFEDFARQEAEDLGLIKDDIGWPYDCIDWEEAAEELQQDYSSVDFDGVDYWVR